MGEPAVTVAGQRDVGSICVPKQALWIVLIVGAAGWALRAFPLVQAGAFGYPVNYDQGVYFTSASLLLQGVLPYRDFVLVHPPGLLYCLAPAAWVGVLRDPAVGLAAARWLVTVVGLVNTVLLGRLVLRWAGPMAALVAASVYATHPEAVSVERGPVLEPWLNLACLCLAAVWLGASARDRAAWRALGAGALCGFAMSIKLTGALWVVAALAAGAPKPRRNLFVFAAAATVAFLVLVAPLALSDLDRFFEQVVSFQLHRPPDGASSLLSRWRGMFTARGLILDSSLIVCGIAFALSRARDPGCRNERFFAAGFILLVAAFLASPAFWDQYNAHLAVPESALAGYGAASAWRWASRGRARFANALLAAWFVAVIAWGIRRGIRTGEQRSPELIAVGHFLRTEVPPGAAVFALDPAWSLAGGRLPAAGVVDVYATMLIEALRTGRPFANAPEAIRDPASQAILRRALDRAQFAIVQRDDGRLTPEVQRWFHSRFVRRWFEAKGRNDVEVFEHKP
jgi:hypothetical protein